MRGYHIVSLAIGVFYVAALVALVGGCAVGTWLWMEADSLAGHATASAPAPHVEAGQDTLRVRLSRFTTAELTSAAVVLVTGGITFGLFFGFVAQLLSMLRDQAINSDRQVRLLSELVALREQEMSAVPARRVAPCEGCGQVAGVERIESGQWVCVACRRALRSA